MNSPSADSPVTRTTRATAWIGKDERRITRRRQPASVDSTPHNTLIQAAHLARHISGTLLERPISVANTPFVVDSLRALHALETRLLRAAPRLAAPHQVDCERLLQLLRQAFREPSPQHLRELSRFVTNELPIYTSLFRRPYEQRPLSRDVFRNRKPERVVVMIGPGIGIGDEVKVTQFMQRLRVCLGVPPAKFEVYSFCPWLWTALAPGMTVEGLAAAPLGAFDRVRKLRAQGTPGRVLVVFACFMRQNALSCLAPFRQSYDALELAVASGEVWVRLSGDTHEYTYCALDAHTPNYSRALSGILGHLFPTEQLIANQPSAYRPRARQTVRLVLNPFTSKHSPLTPADWAHFLQCVRHSLPSGKNLICKIVPGLTPSCHAYACEIQAVAQKTQTHSLTVRLLDDGRPAFTQFNAIEEVHNALTSADLLLTIDTYTAHLAAQMRLVSLALCLNRNVRFWDPAPNTFWLNIRGGYSPVGTVIGAVAKLIARDSKRKTFDRFSTACRDLISLGHPSLLRDRLDLGARLPLWREKANAVWEALPPRIAHALVAIDSDYAWPSLQRSFSGANEMDSRVAMNLMADSCFFRIAWLGALDENAERHSR